jgi:hypothetical protein
MEAEVGGALYGLSSERLSQKKKEKERKKWNF